MKRAPDPALCRWPLDAAPLHLRAAAEDAALMTPSVMELESHYRELAVSPTIIAGAHDQVADMGRPSESLHGNCRVASSLRSLGLVT